MKRTLLTVIFALTMAAGAAAQSPGKDDQPLKDAVKQLIDAQTRFDATALDKLLAADYIEVSPAGEFDPRPKVLSFYGPQARPDPAKMSTSAEAVEFSIRSDGKIAIVIVKLNYAITSDGKPLPLRSMRATFVVRKEGAAWKFASAQYTSVRPPQAPKP